MNRQQRRAEARAHRVKNQVDGIKAFERVLGRTQPFTSDEIMKLALPIRMSFQAIKSGKGVEQDIHDILSIVNNCVVLSANSPPAYKVATAAVDAIQRMWERYQRTGRIGLDGPAITEVEACIELHEIYIREAKPGQLVDAMETVMRIRRKETA